MAGVSQPNEDSIISVPIGRWAVATAPVRLRTLLGSCVAVILHDRLAQAGGIAHILLPDSQGMSREHPGRYADTAIPALIADMERLALARSRLRITAKLAGGATMFSTAQPDRIGDRNGKAVEAILAGLGIPVVARDLGGDTGRRVTLDPATGRVAVKIPGGREYDI